MPKSKPAIPDAEGKWVGGSKNFLEISKGLWILKLKDLAAGQTR